MLTAMQAVENVLNGVVDKANLWQINSDQEYHEEKTSAEESEDAIDVLVKEIMD
jgi:hypothetical protein